MLSGGGRGGKGRRSPDVHAVRERPRLSCEGVLGPPDLHILAGRLRDVTVCAGDREDPSQRLAMVAKPVEPRSRSSAVTSVSSNARAVAARKRSAGS